MVPQWDSEESEIEEPDYSESESADEDDFVAAVKPEKVKPVSKKDPAKKAVALSQSAMIVAVEVDDMSQM